MKEYLFLLLAIIFEIAGTTMLKATEQFTKLAPSILTILAYAVTFYFLSLAMRTIPVGIAYAIWSGVGIVFIALVGWIVFKQHLDLAAILGMGLIIAGVLVINLFSKSAGH